MFQNTYPVFQEKRLLKKEMLENLRDFPRVFFDMQYQGYSDGILSGCGIEPSDAGLIIQPGVLRYGGIFYFLREPCPVSCQADGTDTFIKVRFLDKTIGIGQEEYLSRIYADGQTPDPNCELELGRFKLQPGARLRTEYVDFYDHVTEFDTVNRIHVPYASQERHSIWPQILKTFAGEMMRFPIQNPWDGAFILSSLQLKEAMSYEAVRAYLNMRLGQEGEYTNAQIYEALKGILQGAGEREDRPGRRTENREKKVLMI